MLEASFANIPPVPSWHCDMRVSLMRMLILRSAWSAQNTVHKKPQPFGPLMLGDSHDTLRHCGDEAGAPSFVSSRVLWLTQGDQLLQALAPFLCKTFVLTLLNIAGEPLNVTIKIILIPWRLCMSLYCCFIYVSWVSWKQSKTDFYGVLTLQGTLSVFNQRCSRLPVQMVAFILQGIIEEISPFFVWYLELKSDQRTLILHLMDLLFEAK